MFMRTGFHFILKEFPGKGYRKTGVRFRLAIRCRACVDPNGAKFPARNRACDAAEQRLGWSPFRSTVAREVRQLHARRRKTKPSPTKLNAPRQTVEGSGTTSSRMLSTLIPNPGAVPGE